MLKQLSLLCLTGIAQELIWVAACSLGPLREHTGPFLELVFLAFALCLWSYFRIPIQAWHGALLVMLFALMFRFTVLFAPPYQSEDVYRYLWDARVASIGIDPYRFPPNAPELEGVRDAQVYPMINSKPYITAYPPVSQILFRLCLALFGINVTAMKAIFSLLEFSALLLAWRLLRLWGCSNQSLYLMAWNPFFVFEFSHSGHSESAMMFLILLSVYLLSRSARAWAMTSYACAVGAKLHPALWFPLFLRRIGWKAALAGLGAGTALALAYFDFSSLLRYLNSLSLYFRLFEFNAGIHYLLRYVGRSMFHQSWDKATGPYLGAALLLTTVLITSKFPLRNARDLLHAGFWLMAADLCLATTVHPWYLSWAALALPIFPYAFMAYWTGACFLSYIAYASRPAFEPTWVLLVEYLPMYGFMVWEIWRRRPLLESWLRRSEL